MSSKTNQRVVVVRADGSRAHVSATAASQLVEQGRAFTTGKRRVQMIAPAEDVWQWRGRQSGYGGPRVMQRVQERVSR